jgi:hypothetical protein
VRRAFGGSQIVGTRYRVGLYGMLQWIVCFEQTFVILSGEVRPSSQDSPT